MDLSLEDILESLVGKKELEERDIFFSNDYHWYPESPNAGLFFVK
jgi:hypothetical protein